MINPEITNITSKITNSLMENWLTYVISLCIIIITYIVAKFTSYKANKLSNKYQNIAYEALSNLIFYVIMAIGLLFALINTGIQLSSILVVLSCAGLAIALGLQDVIKQISSSIMIIIYNMYKINDVVNINGNIGRVIEFNLFKTTIVSTGNIKTIIPNNKISDSNFINYSRDKMIIVDIPITIANLPNINIEYFISILKKTVALSPYIVDKKKVDVVIGDIDLNGTIIKIKAPINGRRFTKANENIRMLVRKLLVNTDLLKGYINNVIIPPSPQ
jgi:small conductance mechanosensitive channel